MAIYENAVQAEAAKNIKLTNDEYVLVEGWQVGDLDNLRKVRSVKLTDHAWPAFWPKDYDLHLENWLRQEKERIKWEKRLTSWWCW